MLVGDAKECVTNFFICLWEHKCSVVANIARSQWCLKQLFVQTAGRGQLAVREKTSSRICTAQTIPLLIRCLNGCLL